MGKRLVSVSLLPMSPITETVGSMGHTRIGRTTMNHNESGTISIGAPNRSITMDGILAHIEHIIIHIGMRVSHNSCPECRADNSRSFARSHPFHYAHVHAYLSWVRPRLVAIRNGETRVEAIWWHRDFIVALHNRISSHIPGQNGRKHAPTARRAVGLASQNPRP